MDRREFAIGVASGSFIFGSGNIMAQGQRPQRIEMGVNVTPPVYGELTVFSLLKPNNSLSTANTFTDINGHAVATFNLRKKDPSGIYNGQVKVTVNGLEYSDSASVVV